ncbi:MAG: ferritin-like domain-containing protein [Chlamydiales bacterium]
MASNQHEQFYHMFLDELREVYSGIEQVLNAYPKFINCVTSDKLKKELQNHFKEVQKQKDRLESVFDELSETSEGAFSDGIAGLLKECDKVINKDVNDLVKEAALISSLQKIEHYEIATFGSLRTFAKHLDLSHIEHILQDILNEQGKTNQNLIKIAEGGYFTSGINARAVG